MVTGAELELLQASQATVRDGGSIDRLLVEVAVSGCAYSCCGRGWLRKDGYEQTYRGWVDNLEPPEGAMAGTFMLYSPGIGTLSYVVAVRFDEVQEVRECQMAT
jgi:hypothetical protein